MKFFSDYRVLVLPGRDGSGDDHWQTLWERLFPEFVRVQQRDWVRPVYSEWGLALTDAVTVAEKPVLLIAHSAGTSLTMRWAADRPDLARKVVGAFLVAPSDRDVLEGSPDNPIQGFGPMILKPLPFRSVVIASQNDPLVSFDRAKLFAQAWQSTLVDAGMQGHLGSAAKLGVWPQGLVTLGQFIATL
ncbi:MAG: alpha/beta hydrolase [Rhodoferax sp.]|nr:alpha/beta hydrolase [Rhodoferax sp.]